MYNLQTTDKKEREEIMETALKSLKRAKRDYLTALENLNENRPITLLRANECEIRLLRVRELVKRVNPFLLVLNKKLNDSTPFYPRDETGLLLCFNEANNSFKGE